MGFLEGIAAWFMKKLLDYLLNRAIVEVNAKLAQMKLDQQRGEINEKNVKAYEEASDRRGKIDAALDLLNRT